MRSKSYGMLPKLQSTKNNKKTFITPSKTTTALLNQMHNGKVDRDITKKLASELNLKKE